jgi:hypothetical protein
LKPARLYGPIVAALVGLVAIAIRVTDPSRRQGSDPQSLVELVRDPPITVVEAGIAALALIVLVRQILILVLRRRPRPVDVRGATTDIAPASPQAAAGASVDPAGSTAGDAPPVKSWSALVKATLHKLGALPEPSVPLGAIQPTALSLVDLKLPAQASLVAGVLRVALDRLALETPYRVTATFLPANGPDGDGGFGVLLEMIDVQTRQLEAHHHITAPSLGMAAREAACLIYQDVTSRGRTPPWERWAEPGSSSLLDFLAGIEAESAGNHVDALRRYRDAARAEPANAVIHLRLGNLQEREHLLNEAVETYSETLLTWPQLSQTRHRLALTLVAIAMNPDVDVAPATRKMVRLLLSDSPDMPAADDERDELLLAAQHQWHVIGAGYRWDRAWLARVRRTAPVSWRTGKIVPRGPMRRSARVAELGVVLYRLHRKIAMDPGAATEAQRQQLLAVERSVRGLVSAGPARRIMRSLTKTAPDFRAHYNCACIYGVLLQAGLDSATYVDRAIDQLRRVLRAGKTERVFGWALDDPDLAALWALVEDERPSVAISESQTAALELLRHQFAAGPTIRRLTPSEAPPGALVRIRGINLEPTDDSEAMIWFGTASVAATAVATRRFDTEIEVLVPSSVPVGQVGVAVVVADRTSSTKPFRVLGAEPQ